MTDQSLDSLRARLLDKDRLIVELLNERAKLSVAIGQLKQTENIAVYDPSREERIYSHIETENRGPLSREALKDIYREIISASRNLQKPLSIAYLGPEASFTYLATRRHFGTSTHSYPLATVFDVFEEVERGRADSGVVPVDNSLEGSVKMTLDKLISTNLRIVGEIFMPVSHCLLSTSTRIEDLQRVYSHPQALAQCQQWIRTNLPHCEVREAESTAQAAKRVVQEPTGAAIAAREAASLYGLSVIASGIEDHRSNVTRFLVIGSVKTAVTGRDKTSLIFAGRHEPGSLLRALEPFSAAGINLTKIVSHPVKERAWEYLFFVDFLGHAEEDRVAFCLDQLEKECTFVKVLGSYPAGEMVP